MGSWTREDQPPRWVDELVAAIEAECIHPVSATGAKVHAGWESVVLETADGWMYRFPRPHVDFDRELALLRRLRGRLPVPIPEVTWTGRRTRVAAYRKLEGSVFDVHAYAAASTVERSELTDSLAAFLAAMHGALTDDDVADLAVPTADGSDSTVAGIEGRLSTLPASTRRPILTLLDETRARMAARIDRSDDTVAPVVMHNDFHFSNMVLSGPTGRVAGVWDFSCVELGYAASDLRYLANDSVELAGRVADRYTDLTGRRLELRDAVIAGRLEQVADALGDQPDVEERAEDLEKLVAGWSD